MSFTRKMLDAFDAREPDNFVPPPPVEADVEGFALPQASAPVGGFGAQPMWNGDTFASSFGATIYQDVTDLPTLRARSAQLVRRSLYARGFVGRLVDNEINTGLELEATPIAELVGMSEEETTAWDSDVETRFALWGMAPGLVDSQGLRTFGALQALIRREAIIGGDVLVILDLHANAKTPVIRLAPAESVCSPAGYTPPPTQKVVDGVEVEVASGKVLGYWVHQQGTLASLGEHTFIPASGQASGRRIAWLVYGSPRRAGEYRGEPLLSTIFQSIAEIGRYRDAALRKATINAMIAVFVEKTQDKPAGLSLAAGAVRKGNRQLPENGTDVSRTFAANRFNPGIVLEELQVGETVKSFGSTGTDIAFREFEQAMVLAMAWAYGIPVEVLTLTFGSNYAASQAALNEFRMYLSAARQDFGEQFCTRVYREWLLAEVLTGRIRADAWIRAMTNPAKYADALAWTCCEWSGPAKPVTDVLKTLKAYEIAQKYAWITPSQITREVFGSNFRGNVRKARSELKLLREIQEIGGFLENEVANGNEPSQTDSEDLEPEEGQDPKEATPNE